MNKNQTVAQLFDDYPKIRLYLAEIEAFINIGFGSIVGDFGNGVHDAAEHVGGRFEMKNNNWLMKILKNNIQTIIHKHKIQQTTLGCDTKR